MRWFESKEEREARLAREAESAKEDQRKRVEYLAGLQARADRISTPLEEQFEKCLIAAGLELTAHELLGRACLVDTQVGGADAELWKVSRTGTYATILGVAIEDAHLLRLTLSVALYSGEDPVLWFDQKKPDQGWCTLYRRGIGSYYLSKEERTKFHLKLTLL